MSVRQPTADRIAMPDQLTSPRAKLVYFYLVTHGETTIETLRDELNVSLMALYATLGTLREHGLVENDGERYWC